MECATYHDNHPPRRNPHSRNVSRYLPRHCHKYDASRRKESERECNVTEVSCRDVVVAYALFFDKLVPTSRCASRVYRPDP